MIRTAAMAILLATSFMSHAAEEANSKADPAKGKVIAETVCVACHGADGNSLASANPHLAGQGAEYVLRHLFRRTDVVELAESSGIDQVQMSARDGSERRLVAPPHESA